MLWHIQRYLWHQQLLLRKETIFHQHQRNSQLSLAFKEAAGSAVSGSAAAGPVVPVAVATRVSYNVPGTPARHGKSSEHV